MTYGDTGTRDKVIALERDVVHLTEKMEELTSTINELRKLTAEMNRNFQSIRGGHRVLLALLGTAGTIGAGIASAIRW